MTSWQQWVQRPQGLWLRRALFQIHLWSGIGAGLYVLIISITGSAVVYRPEIQKALSTKPHIVAAVGPRLSDDDLKQAALRPYPDYEVKQIWRPRNPKQAVEIWLERGRKSRQRLFDPYTGADLGEPLRFGFRVISWVVDLHDNLLGGKTGRFVNGIGAILATVLCLTGAVIWWPGIKNWRHSLTVDWKANWKKLNWDLHGALGAWFIIFVLMWALSGIYLCFPGPFDSLLNAIDLHDPSGKAYRFGLMFFFWLTRIHFGRFAGWPVKVLWIVIGLVPAALFVTGALMWWNRVLKKALDRYRKDARIVRQTAIPVLIGTTQKQ
jgi:uncharacterized iron-regulated membrane protein